MCGGGGGGGDGGAGGGDGGGGGGEDIEEGDTHGLAEMYVPPDSPYLGTGSTRPNASPSCP